MRRIMRKLVCREPGYKLCVKPFSEQQKWAAMIGYCTKDSLESHYRVELKGLLSFIRFYVVLTHVICSTGNAIFTFLAIEKEPCHTTCSSACQFPSTSAVQMVLNCNQNSRRLPRVAAWCLCTMDARQLRSRFDLNRSWQKRF